MTKSHFLSKEKDTTITFSYQKESNHFVVEIRDGETSTVTLANPREVDSAMRLFIEQIGL